MGHRPAPAPDLLTIGEFADRTGVSATTLRAWEQRVGFPDPVRTSGGQRRYRGRDVDLVEQVRADRRRGLSLEDAVAAIRRSQTLGHDSLYATVRRDHPELETITVSARTLLTLTWSIEDECLVRAAHPVVLGCFQNEASYASSGRRWRELARSAAAAIVLSDFAESAPQETPARIALPPESPLLNEWSLVCVDPRVCVALIAWERPRERGTPRRFEAVLSMRPAVVHDAVERCVAIAEAAGVSWPGSLTASLVHRESAADAEDPHGVALLRRFARYADETPALRHSG